MKKKAKSTARSTDRPRDIAVLHGPTEDGQGARLLRFRGDSVQAGEIRPAREGQPIGALGKSELVRLKPLHRELPVCEIEVLHSADDVDAEVDAKSGDTPAPTRTGVGPARVSTQRYRRNWNAVFGSKPTGHDEPSGGDETDYSVN